jgi:hypothetical protein
MNLFYHKTLAQSIIVETEDGMRFRHDGLTLKPIDLKLCTPYLVPHSYDENLIPVPEHTARFYLPQFTIKQVAAVLTDTGQPISPKTVTKHIYEGHLDAVLTETAMGNIYMITESALSAYKAKLPTLPKRGPKPKKEEDGD